MFSSHSDKLMLTPCSGLLNRKKKLSGRLKIIQCTCTRPVGRILKNHPDVTCATQDSLSCLPASSNIFFFLTIHIKKYNSYLKPREKLPVCKISSREKPQETRATLP